MWFTEKRARKSSKSAQLSIFTHTFSKLKAFSLLQPPKFFDLLKVLTEIGRCFTYEKGHCVGTTHVKSGFFFCNTSSINHKLMF